MMQTAVRQAMPYALDRKQLNQNFSVKRDAPVTTRIPTGPKRTLGIASQPFTEPNTIHARSHSNLGYISPTSLAGDEGRPKSDSTMTALDKTYLKDIDNHQIRSERIYLEADRDRQSMRDLVEFLRSSQPPPENYMSSRDPDFGRQFEKPSKRPPFALFRKRGSRKNLPRDVQTNLLQLPDSAVAATTIEGHRHIAISIPVEYHPHEPMPARYDNKPETLITPPIPIRNSRGTVTVLRPVLEDNEFSSAQREVGVYKKDTHTETSDSPKETTPDSSGSVPDSDETLTVLFHRQEKRDVPEENKEQGRLYRNYTMPPVSNINRMDSVRSDIDPRHSGGTMYSERTLPTTETTHSRDVSSGSASQTSNHVVTPGPITHLPTRRSSLTQAYATNPAQSPTKTDMDTADGDTHSTPELEAPISPTEAPPTPIEPTKARSIAESTFSDTSEAVVISAEVAQAYPGAATISAEHFKNPGPAPNRKLPDLPEGSDDAKSIRTMRSVRRSTSERKPSVSTEDQEKANLRIVQKNRKEAVEARIRRDLALEKARRSTQTVFEAIKPLQPTPQPKRTPSVHVARMGSTASSYKGHHRRCSSNISAKKDRRKNMNSLSPILLVAEFSPQAGRYFADSYTFPAPPRSQPYISQSKRSSHEIHTPPRSASPSLPSSDEECNYSPTRRAAPPPAIGMQRIHPQHKRGMSSTATNGVRIRELHSAPQISEGREWQLPSTSTSATISHRRGMSSTATNGLRPRELSAAALLDERRELRREKMDAIVYDAELDERMRKMERHVAQLVDMNRSVLEIGKQLGSIGKILGEEGASGLVNGLNMEGPGRGKGILVKSQGLGRGQGRGHGRDLWGVEPLMREIIGGIKRG